MKSTAFKNDDLEKPEKDGDNRPEGPEANTPAAEPPLEKLTRRVVLPGGCDEALPKGSGTRARTAGAIKIKNGGRFAYSAAGAVPVSASLTWALKVRAPSS